MSNGWRARLKGGPLPWLLDPEHPGVRAATLERLFDRPPGDAETARLRADAMKTDPIRSMLAAQDAEGWWVKRGAGYAPKFTGTAWQIIFLDQLGADLTHPAVRRGCDYLLRHAATAAGGFGSSSRVDLPQAPPWHVIHCLNGNLLRAFIGFGYLEDSRIQAAIAWAASRISGEAVETWYPTGTSGPGFACGANGGMPCAWGAVKELGGLIRVPTGSRTPAVSRAIEMAVEFLLSRDPAVADYPMGWGNTVPHRVWFKPGFPLGGSADILQNLEFLAEAGHARDPRAVNAIEWLVSKQGPDGRWKNQYAYNAKTTVDIEKQGQPSKWVTLRACTVLRAAFGD